MIADDKSISQAVIARLPRYYRYLGDLKDNGIERISSQDLSELMKVTASQIRQDFNNFGGFGQQGYGYNVKYLYNEIARILGLNTIHNLIIVGAGNLGQALANYTDFERWGFIVKGIFDKKSRALYNKKNFQRGIRHVSENQNVCWRCSPLLSYCCSILLPLYCLVS